MPAVVAYSVIKQWKNSKTVFQNGDCSWLEELIYERFQVYLFYWENIGPFDE